MSQMAPPVMMVILTTILIPVKPEYVQAMKSLNVCSIVIATTAFIATVSKHV
jgi:hypothetical protein